MKKNIFYSWQSDLPNNQNRSFIQDCIEKAVKELGEEKVLLEIAIDRDTKGVAGTPDIASSVFSKIDESNIFIADISFINSDSTNRKTPNPNVLVELGYAAKTIGWNNIICIFNANYGKVEDLPFDLRFRRPLVYQITNPSDKSKDKKALSESIKRSLTTIIESESAKDEIRLFIKQQVDKEIVGICNQLHKIIYGYNKGFSLEAIWELLSLSQDQINNALFEIKHIGFTILKDWSEFHEKLQGSMNQPFFTQNAEPKFISGLIKVIRALETMVLVCKNPKLFVDTGSQVEGYSIIAGEQLNDENPKDNYLLLKSIPDSNSGKVVDFGVIRKYNTKKALQYQIVDNEHLWGLNLSIHELLEGINTWTTNTGNHLIIDPLTFRF